MFGILACVIDIFTAAASSARWWSELQDVQAEIDTGRIWALSRAQKEDRKRVLERARRELEVGLARFELAIAPDWSPFRLAEHTWRDRTAGG
jgi:hypothetical protein